MERHVAIISLPDPLGHRPAPAVSGGNGLAAIDTRIVRADAVGVDRAPFPDAALPAWATSVNDTCLKEAFPGNERDELPARAEVPLLSRTDLEPEPGKVAARAVNLPQRICRGSQGSWGCDTPGARVILVIVFVNAVRPAERGGGGRESSQGKRKDSRW